MIAGGAMAFSSVSVVLNALRLKKSISQKELKMKKKIKIEGMTCQHCVSRVKIALQELDYSANIKVNLSKKKQ